MQSPSSLFTTRKGGTEDGAESAAANATQACSTVRLIVPSFDFTEVRSEAMMPPSSVVSISTNTSRRRAPGEINKNREKCALYRQLTFILGKFILTTLDKTINTSTAGRTIFPSKWWSCRYGDTSIFQGYRIF